MIFRYPKRPRTFKTVKPIKNGAPRRIHPHLGRARIHSFRRVWEVTTFVFKQSEYQVAFLVGGAEKYHPPNEY